LDNSYRFRPSGFYEPDALKNSPVSTGDIVGAVVPAGNVFAATAAATALFTSVWIALAAVVAEIGVVEPEGVSVMATEEPEATPLIPDTVAPINPAPDVSVVIVSVVDPTVCSMLAIVYVVTPLTVVAFRLSAKPFGRITLAEPLAPAITSPPVAKVPVKTEVEGTTTPCCRLARKILTVASGSTSGVPTPEGADAGIAALRTRLIVSPRLLTTEIREEIARL